MPIESINRQLITISVSAAATIGPDVNQVVADATSAGFTLTLTDYNDGALHQVEFFIDPDDTSGNNVTIQGNATAFSTSISSDGATSALIQTQYDGTWVVVADVSSVDAAAANSRAVSAGLAASGASSAATSGVSHSDSVATSQNLSQSTTISSTGSVAGSATLSGVSATASVATSQNASQSLNVSSAMSLAAS